MLTLSHAPVHVHSAWPTTWSFVADHSELLDVEPALIPDDSDIDSPSEEDSAYWSGYSTALYGDLKRPLNSPSIAYGYSVEMDSAWYRGATEGLSDRTLAWSLGKAMGYCSGISEPPTGFNANQKAAYRDGFQTGDAEFQEDRALDAYLASEEQERLYDHFSVEIQDRDIYPQGCMS